MCVDGIWSIWTLLMSPLCCLMPILGGDFLPADRRLSLAALRAPRACAAGVSEGAAFFVGFLGLGTKD